MATKPINRKTGEQYRFYVETIQNRVTRSTITLDPLFGFDQGDELTTFEKLVGDYCELAWRLGVIDVTSIKAVDWVNDWTGSRAIDKSVG